ncbi:MAG: alpha/beta hydrolase [Dehalococcoidia bacterium]
MPLDPQAKVLIDQMAALGLPPLHTLSAAEARAQMLARRAAMPAGASLAQVEDRTAPGPAGAIPVRIYVPEGDGSLPVIAYFHGGGWVIGNIESHDWACRELAHASGCIVVSADYRLAPEHKFPAAAEDAYAATVWVAENASSFGGDATRLAVAGDSAGGNLASLMARDRGGPGLAFQLLIYPVTDFDLTTPSYSENAQGYSLTRDSMVWFWNQYLNGEHEAKHPHASPLQAEDLTGLPPALVITAEYDPLRDEGEKYAARLKAAGVAVTLTRYDGMIHGFFSMAHLLDKGRAAIDQSGAALREALLAPVPSR